VLFCRARRFLKISQPFCGRPVAESLLAGVRPLVAETNGVNSHIAKAKPLRYPHRRQLRTSQKNPPQRKKTIFGRRTQNKFFAETTGLRSPLYTIQITPAADIFSGNGWAWKVSNRQEPHSHL